MQDSEKATERKLYSPDKGNPYAMSQNADEAARASIWDVLYPHRRLPYALSNAVCWAWTIYILPNPPKQALRWHDPVIELLGARLLHAREMLGAKEWAPIQRRFLREVQL